MVVEVATDPPVEEEIQILQSTETNGDLSTVDPAVFTFNAVQNAEAIAQNLATGYSQSSMAIRGKSSSPELHYGQRFEVLPNLSSDDEMDDGDTNRISSDSESNVEKYHEISRKQLVGVVIPQTKFPPLPYASSRSGLVYDAQMRFHHEPAISSDRLNEIHPEDPARIYEIFKELLNAGLVHDVMEPDLPTSWQMLRINIREATTQEIQLVHTRSLRKWVKSLNRKTEDELIDEAQLGDSIYVNNYTYWCARLAAGGAIDACKAVVAGQVKNSVAVIRPPGHHAEPHKAGGFCFFNNVSIAARVCQQDFPETCRKILILDWDVHHGNGVQKAFYDDPNVLYISLHVHLDGHFYPQGNYGDHLHNGEGLGEGRNVNIPWKREGMTDADYLFAFQQVVMPIAQEFNPDLVIIAAGFDAAEGDELGKCHVSPAGYAHMTHMLMSLANGKVAVCLEGGYNLRSIAKSTLAVTRTLMGEPPERIENAQPTPYGVDTVQLVIRTQARYWASMYPKAIERDVSEASRKELKGERMHDIYRQYQGNQWWDDYKMTPLFIHRTELMKSFDRQVLATQDYHERRPLLVIFHDPPDTHGIPNPRTSRLELHNVWVTDVAKTYVDWAVKNDFSVIDVNIPKHITDLEDAQTYEEDDDHADRATVTRELATYIWENYIEIHEASHIFLLGIGDAYIGIIELLSNKPTCFPRITKTIAFVADNALKPVRRPADDETHPIANLFLRKSAIFVSRTHAVWQIELKKKRSKRFGLLVQSDYANMNEMLVGHRDEVFRMLKKETSDWMLEQPIDTQIML
ncbi:MAG: Histone deacetylase hda1 [Bogoriella megaspora]|nr:MAG: Histone deacetylase hda1 [Bogoriella megaspora]